MDTCICIWVDKVGWEKRKCNVFPTLIYNIVALTLGDCFGGKKNFWRQSGVSYKIGNLLEMKPNYFIGSSLFFFFVLFLLISIFLQPDLPTFMAWIALILAQKTDAFYP